MENKSHKQPSSDLCPLPSGHCPPSSAFWHDKRVLITGHTGFKGSWLACWLRRLGAEVYGYSLEPPIQPNHFEVLKLDINSTIGDIRNLESLKKAILESKPEIVFHLAAQPLVRLSYEEPVNTFETNVMGTLNVFEGSRASSTVKAIINVTSDKCYENREWDRGYHEDDRMGGHDPYSASKGCSELLTSSYRNSYFNNEAYGKEHNTLLASCRAGNVIGGGDWAVDRLIPDIIRGASINSLTELRNPHSTRPWQHVLEPLSGYLLLGQKLLEGKKEFAEAWNFGPDNQETLTVREVAEELKQHWDRINYTLSEDTNAVHEAKLLKVDSSKAKEKLKWIATWDSRTAIAKTVEWYKNYYENGIINTEKDIEEFVPTRRQ